MLGSNDDLPFFVYRVNGVMVMKKHLMQILFWGYCHKEHQEHYPAYYLNYLPSQSDPEIL